MNHIKNIIKSHIEKLLFKCLNLFFYKKQIMQFSTFDLIEISLQEVQNEFPMSKKGCKSFYNKDGVFIPKKFVKKMCEKLCL